MKKSIIVLLCLVGYSSLLFGQDKKQNGLQSAGHLKLVDPENNTFMIITDSGKRYIPVNLSKKFRIDGMRIVFNGIIDTSGLKNVRLSAVPIKIKKIKKDRP